MYSLWLLIRYRPVHVSRPKRVSLPADYFVSGVSSLVYEPLNEAWEVYFYENNKKSSKPFPIKKWGVRTAKEKATEFADKMKVWRFSLLFLFF